MRLRFIRLVLAVLVLSTQQQIAYAQDGYEPPQSAVSNETIQTFNAASRLAVDAMGNTDERQNKAASLYLQAAESGHIEAAYLIGHYYQSGIGVQKDMEKAVRWLSRAGEAGDRNAQFALGMIYRRGEDVPQDNGKAAHWLRMAAESHHASAEYEIGLMYKTGEGVVQDYEKALHWFQLGANRGWADGAVAIGNMYASGVGVAKDAHLAERYYCLAALADGSFSAKSEALQALGTDHLNQTAHLKQRCGPEIAKEAAERAARVEKRRQFIRDETKNIRIALFLLASGFAVWVFGFSRLEVRQKIYFLFASAPAVGAVALWIYGLAYPEKLKNDFHDSYLDPIVNAFQFVAVLVTGLLVFFLIRLYKRLSKVRKP